jgi:purine-binding chemotaxis protein CheW
MMMEIKTGNQVVQQNLALDAYLKTLLDNVPQDQPEKKQELSLLPKQITVAKQQNRVITSPVRPENRQKDKELIIPVRPLSIMPEWARDEFQVLIFRVGQLILATPLSELQRTLKFDNIVTKIPGQPSWFLGLIKDQGHQVGILDAGQLVLGKSRGSVRNIDEQQFKSLLILNDNKWGLACDEVLSISQMLPEKVRWRTQRKKRPWLIGTVIDELTAIIDVNQLVPQRKAADKI